MATLALACACIPDVSSEDPGAVPSGVAGARTGGTIRLAIDALATIDPGDAHDPATRIVARTLCDTLISIDPETGEARPGLATSWTLADAGRKLFVKLRDGVHFHDGSTLRADDVVASLSRLASERLASPSAGLMSPVSGYAFVHGDLETDNRSLRQELAGVRRIDDLTVEIELEQPSADFALVLSHPATAPVPEEAAASPAFSRAPVCAGPYRLASPWTPGDPVRVERFAGYHGANAAYTGGGAGYADAIEFVPFASRARALRAHRRGRVDVAQVPEGARAPGSTVEGRTGLVELIGFPTTTPPFDRPEVRRALARALDRRAIASAVYAGGRAPLLTMAGTPCVEPGPAGDVDLSDTRVRFYFNDDFTNRALVAAAASAWREAFGLRVDPVPMGWNAYLALGRRPQGFDGIFRYAWQADVPAPDRFLVPLFALDSIGRDNLSGYGDPVFDAAIRRARRATDPAVRADAYLAAVRAVCDAAPMTPVAEDVRELAFAGEVAAARGTGLRAPDGELEPRELYVR